MTSGWSAGARHHRTPERRALYQQAQRVLYDDVGSIPLVYVLSARAVGAGPLHLMFSTVLPNCMGPVVVATTLDFSSAILTTAGLGAQPPAPEWGTMLAGVRDMLGRAHWVVLAPGGAILLAVLCVNAFGDALRDTLDPRRSAALCGAD